MEPKEKDVKDVQDPSPDKDVKDPKESSPADEVFEGEKRSIPYERFKEKVAEAKELKKMIEKMQSDKDTAVAKTAAEMQAYYESEIAKLQRTKVEPDPYSYDLDEEPKFEKKLNPLMEEVNLLKQSLSQLRGERETEKLRSQISTLKSVYPELEEEHVLVVKKAKPDWSMDECAEYSHKYFEDKLKAKWTDMISKKKEAAKKPVFRDDGRLNIDLPEKPKTFGDAKKKMMEWAAQQDRLG